jgi:hypothetical protein
MGYHSQKSYPNIQLGTCKDTIAKSGCFITSFCNLLKKLQIAKITPPELNKKAFPNGGCLLNAAYVAKLYGMDYEKTTKKPKGVCIAETDHYKKKGVPQHFFLWNDGKIIDPLDEKPSWKKNPYHIVSYRVFTLPPEAEEKPKEEKETNSQITLPSEKESQQSVSSEKIQIINEGMTPVAAQIGATPIVATPEDSHKSEEEIVQTWPAQDKDGNPSKIPETEEEWQKISSDEPSFWFVAVVIILSLLTVFLS